MKRKEYWKRKEYRKYKEDWNRIDENGYRSGRSGRTRPQGAKVHISFLLLLIINIK